MLQDSAILKVLFTCTYKLQYCCTWRQFMTFLTALLLFCWKMETFQRISIKVWFWPAYVTWSRGMSWMSGILILSYRLKEVINSYVFHCFWIERIVHISATRCPIEMGFGSKCSILNGKVIYIENQNWILPTLWLIPLDHVTYVWDIYLQAYLILFWLQW